MKIGERIMRVLAQNPLVWFLLALLIVSLHGSYKTGSKLTRVCDLLGDEYVIGDGDKTAKKEIDAICGSRQSNPYEEDRE